MVEVGMSLEPKDQNEDSGTGMDKEMVPVYIKKFLPLLTQLFHSSLSQALR